MLPACLSYMFLLKSPVPCPSTPDYIAASIPQLSFFFASILSPPFEAPNAIHRQRVRPAEDACSGANRCII